MPELQIKEAVDFYHRFILNYTSDKSKVYLAYGFTIQGSIGAKDWEVFAAILVNDRARPGDGADLMHYEVKSAITGNSFEYQYHKNHGVQKLEDDKNIDHIFISRSSDYYDIQVWKVPKTKIAAQFEAWLPALKKNYRNESRQRFRRSISFKFVSEYGDKLLEIRRGQLIFPA